MPHDIVSVNCYYLRQDLSKLQRKWQRKIPYLTKHGRGVWANCVLFGIETAQHRIADDGVMSLRELKALLEAWERISHQEADGHAVEAAKGVDFGIRLVVSRIRRYLDRLARP